MPIYESTHEAEQSVSLAATCFSLLVVLRRAAIHGCREVVCKAAVQCSCLCKIAAPVGCTRHSASWVTCSVEATRFGKLWKAAFHKEVFCLHVCTCSMLRRSHFLQRAITVSMRPFTSNRCKSFSSSPRRFVAHIRSRQPASSCVKCDQSGWNRRRRFVKIRQSSLRWPTQPFYGAPREYSFPVASRVRCTPNGRLPSSALVMLSRSLQMGRLSVYQLALLSNGSTERGTT